MMLLPYERLVIRTRLSPAEVRRKLANVVEQRQQFGFFSSGHKPYQGQVNEFGFNVTRAGSYRNTFRPAVKGRICPEVDGCSIHITMRPHVLLLFQFVVTWVVLFACLLDGLFALFSHIFGVETTTSLPGLSMLGLLFALGYGILLGAFKLESAKSKRFFRELFEAESG
jgi:hypothetical protein